MKGESMLHRLQQLFQLEKLNANFIRFANAFFCFQIASALSSIFIGTFLFVSGGEMSTIALYYVSFYSFEALSVWLTVRLSHRVESRKLTMLGIILYLCAYLILLVAQENTIKFYYIIGSLAGFGSGFYWNGYYTLLQYYTDSENRQTGLSYIGIISNMIALISPSVSGLILAFAPKKIGYVIIFGVAAVFFAASTWITRKLSAVEKRSEPSKIFPLIREFWHDKVVNCMIIAEVMRGFKSGIYAYYFNILILAMTSNELIIGTTSTLKGAVAMLIYYILGRCHISTKRRFALVFIASVMGIFATSSLLFWFTAAAMVVYSIVDGAVAVVVDNNLLLAQYEVSEFMSKRRDLRLENSGIRLLSLEVGRVLGILVSLCIPVGGKEVVVFFVILAILNIPVWAIYKYASKICEGDYQ